MNVARLFRRKIFFSDFVLYFYNRQIFPRSDDYIFCTNSIIYVQMVYMISVNNIMHVLHASLGR